MAHDDDEVAGSTAGDEGEEEEEGEEGSEIPLTLTKDALELQNELAKIKVGPIPIPFVEVWDAADFPYSYSTNSNVEKVILSYSENFRRQYCHLYRDRKPLFLNPINELACEKFVCTTIRPTDLPYKEMYNWEGAAEFVSDYLDFVPLMPEHELPPCLKSPTATLKIQRGHCFDYATVLASLLIGVGFDAYVVSGYATMDVCLMDLTRETCPMLVQKPQPPPVEVHVEVKKYSVKPPKDLKSKFIIKQEEKRLKAIADEEQRLKDIEDEKRKLAEAPPPDPLRGMRIHAWVLVLDGKREVAEPFFIEPFTGLAYPIDTPKFLGIECLWNHKNYWVNMQSCAEGVTQLKYDLGNCTQWEYMFPSNDKPHLALPQDIKHDDDDELEDENEIEKHLDLPPSWVNKIQLTPREYELRCPQGKKAKFYKRAKLEKFAPFLLKDGLVCRLSVYDDLQWNVVLEVKEFYKNRADCLTDRHYNYTTGWVVENFAPGRSRALKLHRYKALGAPADSDRTMTFYTVARVDGLERREASGNELTEHYIHRDDFLTYRYVLFGPKIKKFGPVSEEDPPRPVEKMIARYARDESKPANSDIAEYLYNVNENKVYLTYHRDATKISASTREFVKPTASDDKGTAIFWSVDKHTTFQADVNHKEMKNVELYEMMMLLLKLEEACRDRLQDSERETQFILDDRINEEVALELSVSVYDTARNDKAQKHRAELEEKELEEAAAKEEKELDYLGPFLAQIGEWWRSTECRDKPRPGQGKLTRTQAFKLREDCLSDLKQRLIDKANLIQARFEKETHDLSKKQTWYQQNQVSMQKSDEQEYLSYCSEAMFRIHILELRLARHKEMAPHKYMALEQKIRSDPRLAEFF